MTIELNENPNKAITLSFNVLVPRAQKLRRQKKRKRARQEEEPCKQVSKRCRGRPEEPYT